MEHSTGACGKLAQVQLIWGFVNASVKHHTHNTFIYWVSWQHFYKALTCTASGEWGGKGRIRNARAAGWDRPRGCMRAEEKQWLHTYYMRLAKPLWRGRWTAHVAIVNPETSHCLFGAFWKRWRAISTGQGAKQFWPPSLWNPKKALLHCGHGQLNPIPAAICPTGSS